MLELSKWKSIWSAFISPSLATLTKVRNRVPWRNGMWIPTQPIEPPGWCLGKHFLGMKLIYIYKIKNHFSTPCTMKRLRLGVLAGWRLRGEVLQNQQTHPPVHYLLKIFHPHFDALSTAIWPLDLNSYVKWSHWGPGQAPKKSLMIASDAIVHGQVVARGVEREPTWFGSSIFSRVERKFSSRT